jgi:hypothetical protein
MALLITCLSAKIKSRGRDSRLDPFKKRCSLANVPFKYQSVETYSAEKFDLAVNALSKDEWELDKYFVTQEPGGSGLPIVRYFGVMRKWFDKP